MPPPEMGRGRRKNTHNPHYLEVWWSVVGLQRDLYREKRPRETPIDGEKAASGRDVWNVPKGGTGLPLPDFGCIMRAALMKSGGR